MTSPLKHPLALKLLTLLLLTLLLCIPLSQIGWLVSERGATRERAANELAATFSGPQTLVGPVLAVPYTERWVETELDDKGKPKGRVERSHQRTHLVFPQKMALTGAVLPQERQRGIFSVLFYTLQGGWAGQFPAFDASRIPPDEKGGVIEAGTPSLVFALSDVRGIQGAPALQLAGEALQFVPGIPFGSDGSLLRTGVHAPLAGAALKAFKEGKPLAVDLRMHIVGQERLAIAPVADDTTAKLSLRWPHLSFGGRFLAAQRNATAEGFDAAWAVSSLSSEAARQVRASVDAARAGGPRQLDTFDVALIQPQNAHSMSDRAVKYGALFVGLTLMASFMFELFRKLRLHPVQYALVGLSIALFFLLLLALSEKLAFGLAYALAAGASVALLAVYFSAMLQGWKRGLSLAGFVTALYAALYGLLVSEDNALLMGSLLVFGMLAALMLLTRKVDWYALSPGQDLSSRT